MPYSVNESIHNSLIFRIVIENTRFKTNPWKNELQKDSLQQTVNSKMTKDAQKVGLDGKIRKLLKLINK